VQIWLYEDEAQTQIKLVVPIYLRNLSFFRCFLWIHIEYGIIFKILIDDFAWCTYA